MKEPLSLNDHTVVEAAKQQVSCGLLNEAVILNLKNGIYYGLNPVGARIWDLLQQARTVAEIRSMLMNEFDVEPERCTRDIVELLGELSEHGLIVIYESAPGQILSSPSD